MSRRPLTLDDLAARGRRWRTLRLLVLAAGPISTNALMRRDAPLDGVGDAERQRVRSALRDLRDAGWAVRTDDGWAAMPAGHVAFHAVQPRSSAA